MSILTACRLPRGAASALACLLVVPALVRAAPPARVVQSTATSGDSARAADTTLSTSVPPFRPSPLRWGPTPPGTPHGERARTYDLQHQLIRVRFDWARHAVVGTTTLRVAALDRRLTELAFDAVGMQIQRVTSASGRPLTFDYDSTQLRVHLSPALAPHARTTVTIAYEAVHPRRGAYFIDRRHVMWTQGEVEDTRYWVPTYDAPNDRTTWEMFIRTALNEKALSNGKLAGSRILPGGQEREWHWVLDKPASTYLMTVVTGDYAVLQDTWRGIPVGYWTYPDSVQAAWRGFGMTPRLMDVFSAKLGVPYPWSKYDQVVVPDYTFGGMENITATTQNDDEILHPARAEPQASSFTLVAHELAHQWTGDLVTTRDWGDVWLNEGFATFLEQVAVEAEQGADEAAIARQEARETALEADLQARRPVVFDQWTDSPFELFFSGHIYQKGSVVLQLLRHELGDSVFWSGMRGYLRGHALQTVTTIDFERAMERASGRDLSGFFRQWVFKAGFPAFRVTAAYDSTARTVTWSAEEVQPMDSLTGVFDVDADVVAWTDTAGAPTRGVLRVREGKGTMVMPVASPPLGLRFDDGGWIPGVTDFPRSSAMLAFQLRRDPDVLGRLEAVDALSERGDEVAVVRVLASAARGDRSWGVRQRAVAAVGTMTGDSEARSALLAASADGDARVRQGAAAALRGGRGDHAEIVARLEALQSDSSIDVRSAALGALTALDTAAGWRAARAALEVDSWTDTERANAIIALHAIPGDSAWDLTARYLGPGASRFSREAAIRSMMSRVHSADQAAALAGLLAPVLDADAASVRQLAAQALGALGQASSTMVLEARRAKETDDAVLEAIRAALASIGASSGRP